MKTEALKLYSSALKLSELFDEFLCVQCNTLHGTEFEITCGVCVCAHGFWSRISRKYYTIR